MWLGISELLLDKDLTLSLVQLSATADQCGVPISRLQSKEACVGETCRDICKLNWLPGFDLMSVEKWHKQTS